jgi:flagellar biosynthesis protein FliQ
MSVILMLLSSNRVKALIVALVLAFVQRFPNLQLDEPTLNWLYGLLMTFIAGDTLRPIDPKKPSLLDRIQRRNT